MNQNELQYSLTETSYDNQNQIYKLNVKKKKSHKISKIHFQDINLME